MKKLPIFALALVLMLMAACSTAAPAAPAATAPPPPPTPTPPPMANKLIVYGDTVFFVGKTDPDSCIEKSRYTHGQPVGFRMTAIDPMTGKVADSAALTVTVTYGGKTEDVPMRYRGTGDNPHPGMWNRQMGGAG